jgi:hypothetical protein
MDDMREDAEKLRKELAEAKQEADDAKTQLRQLKQADPPTSAGKREVNITLLWICSVAFHCLKRATGVRGLFRRPSSNTIPTPLFMNNPEC